MKNLLEYIQESLLDGIDKISDAASISDEILTIKVWLEQNCEIPGQVSIVKKGKKHIINSNYSITVANKELVEFPDYIQFGKVQSFYCSGCTLLKSLRGCPTSVINSFSCSGCTSLTTLEGAPEKADSFDCSYCTSLISLVGCPQKLKGGFSCSHCDKLKSLEGGPKIMGSTTANKKSPFNAQYSANNCTSLTSVKGLPEYANDIHIERVYNLSYDVIKNDLPKEFRTVYLSGCGGIIDGDLSTYYKK